MTRARWSTLLAASAWLTLTLATRIPTDAAEPRPGEHSAAGREPAVQQERDWVDNRWSRTEVGRFLASNLEVKGSRVAKALSIRVGDHEEAAVVYDSRTCSLRGGWTGAFLRFDSARFGLMRAPAIAGTLAFQAPPASWSGSTNRFVGLHVHEHRVVLEYTVNGTRVLESPWLATTNPGPVFTRSFEVSTGESPLKLILWQGTPNAAKIQPQAGGTAVLARAGRQSQAFWITAGGATRMDGDQLIVEIPARRSPFLFQVAHSSGSEDELARIAPTLAATGSPTMVSSWLKPGAARWLPELPAVGQRGFDSDILAIDTLTVPYNNPWKALMFLAGVDFTPDGAGYVCTLHGDVWKVTGIDRDLRQLRWKRFATGLFQPLGLKVKQGQVYVLGRDQITRLHDLNQDGEADFYENFCNLIQTSTGGHDYVTCLEVDDRGNFYFVDPKGLHRVAPDGSRMETIATGWRNPNGMGVSPDGSILTVAPQQGEWTPSSQIAEARPGDYFGYGGPRRGDDRPLGYNPPLCWIPHAVDNSSGSQVWVPRESWGPLGGQMLHLLWGRCGLMLVLRDAFGGSSQGAVVPLPGKLLSGPNRGTFNPNDGHLYIAGSTGWQTAAAKDGALQRVRYTGRKIYLPTAWHAHSNGLTLTFAQPIDRASAEDPGSYGIHQWNYRYAAQYGSKDWSVADPTREGRDEVPVKSARLLADGRSIFIETPGLAPVMQMEVKYSLNAADGKSLRNQLWLTLNRVDKTFIP